MEDFMALLSGFGNSVFAFLVLLAIIVAIHELGHYYAGRAFGMSVDCFSLGFGPEIFSRTDKKGMVWRIAAFPLGGYVKFTGDEDATSFNTGDEIPQNEAQKNWLHFRPLWQRAIVIAAGPIANFLLAIFIFSFSLMFFGKTILLPYVDNVVENSAAARAGLQKHDLITHIDGKEIESFTDLQRVVSISAGKTLLVRLKRDNQDVDVTLIPEMVEITDRFGAPLRIGRIGISRLSTADAVITQRLDPFEAVQQGVLETAFLIERSYHFIIELITGAQSIKQLGGPVKIAEISGVAADSGVLPFVTMIALISISIGFFNLLPIPPLDGGHLLFYAIEAITRKPVHHSVKDIGFKIGFVAMISIMLFATWNDITSLYERLL